MISGRVNKIYVYVPENTFDIVPISIMRKIGWDDEFALDFVKSILFEVAPILPLNKDNGRFAGWRIKHMCDLVIF